MQMNRKTIILGAALAASLFFFSYLSSGYAQKSVRWDYSVINSTYIPYTSENQPIVSARANICYIQAEGCRNEDVHAEVNIARMLQDYRLENSEAALQIVRNRAREQAFARAVSKLGAEGWEMITAPNFEFDAAIQNRQGNYTFESAPKDLQPDVYFKRARP
jgi:hypothetical protein